jgi:hypothetical protein
MDREERIWRRVKMNTQMRAPTEPEEEHNGKGWQNDEGRKASFLIATI